MHLHLRAAAALASPGSPAPHHHRVVSTAGRGHNRGKDGRPLVHCFVLTGGPCAGKTSALGRATTYLTARGFRVFCVPETATILFTSGASPEDLDTEDKQLEFQVGATGSQQHPPRAHYALACVCVAVCGCVAAYVWLCGCVCVAVWLCGCGYGRRTCYGHNCTWKIRSTTSQPAWASPQCCFVTGAAWTLKHVRCARCGVSVAEAHTRMWSRVCVYTVVCVTHHRLVQRPVGSVRKPHRVTRCPSPPVV